MRGHSSLHGALDALILCERREGELSASLTLQKCKDDASDIRLETRLSRVVVGYDEDDEEVSTLVVDSIEDAGAAAGAPKARTIPPSHRLLMAMVAEAIDEAGELIRPYSVSGPQVRAVDEQEVRTRFFARIAEQADPGEDREKLFDRQRKSFKRSVEAALKAETLLATEKNGRRFLWVK